MKEQDLTNASVTILLEIDGIVHLVEMKKERYEAIEAMSKMAAEKAYRTKKSQDELMTFLGL